MTTLTHKDLQSIAHAAMNHHKPNERNTKALLAMAKQRATQGGDNHDLIDLVDSAEFDLDVSGSLNEGLALKLAEALLEDS